MVSRNLTFDELDDSAGASTMRFSVDDGAFEIDLCPANRKEFDDFLACYIAVARPIAASKSVAAKPKALAGPSASIVRSWCQANEVPVSPTGRVGSESVKAYLSAQNVPRSRDAQPIVSGNAPA